MSSRSNLADRFEKWYEENAKNFITENLGQLSEDQIGTMMWLAYMQSHRETVEHWRETLQNAANEVLGDF